MSNLHFVMTFIYRQLVCVGGHKITNKLEIYSFELDMWSSYATAQVGLMPSRLVGLITVNKSLYLVSGLDLLSSSFIRDIYVFNANNRTVSLIGSLTNSPFRNVLILFNV